MPVYYGIRPSPCSARPSLTPNADVGNSHSFTRIKCGTVGGAAPPRLLRKGPLTSAAQPDVCQPASRFFSLSQQPLSLHLSTRIFTTETSADRIRTPDLCSRVSLFPAIPLPRCPPGPLKPLFEDDCTRPTTRFQASSRSSSFHIQSSSTTPRLDIVRLLGARAWSFV